RAEITHGQSAGLFLLSCPGCRMKESPGQQSDIETQFCRTRVRQFFLWRKQIEQERRQSGIVEHARDELIARTVPAAAAAVNEKNQGGRLIDYRQISIECGATGWNTNLVQVDHAVRCAARKSNSRTSSSLVCEKSS